MTSAPAALQMLGDDRRAADEVGPLLEQNAHRRGLGLSADHGAHRCRLVDDRVAHDMNPLARQARHVCPAGYRTSSSFRFHQRQKLLKP